MARLKPKKAAALVALTLVGAFAVALPARACVICMPYPQKTAADQIVESDTAVFARENHEQPFTFAPIEVLKGRYDGGPIPLLLDTATSRELNANAALAVALVQDHAGSAWTRLGAGGPEYQAVLREVAQGEIATMTPAKRAKFFAPYLRSKAHALAELAFLEVARAPYASIRDLRTGIAREVIYSRINDLFHVEWHSLYILMLGMSDRPDDIAFVRGKLNAATRFGMTANLAAYATALIEMDGEAAVRLLAGEYFTGAVHGDAELVEVVKALSVHGNEGRAELRAAVIDAYGALLDVRPALAGYVADDLFNWNATHLGPRMRAILDAGFVVDEASKLAVMAYVGNLDRGRGAAAGEVVPAGAITKVEGTGRIQ
jgi:hypothetical protein